MLALCPNCLQPSDLKEVQDPERGLVLRCSNPKCDYPTVPLLYGEDYHAHPPLPVSIIGLSGHGKTVFIESLLQEIKDIGVRWGDSGFFFTWLDEVQMRKAYARLRALREGQLPSATRTLFQQPQVLRLSHIPRIGGSQLIIFDVGGEAFLDSTLLADAGKYVRNSSSIVWLLSLRRGDPYDTPDDVNQMMTVYLQTMAQMGGKTKDQNLVLVLTKGDELLNRPDLPESARKALATADYNPAGPVWGLLEQASNDLEAWLRSPHCGYHNLVNLVRSRFKQVRYCILSAQGAAAGPDGLIYGTMPRGVIAPLLWLWRLGRDPVWVERGNERILYLNAAEAVAAADGGVVQLEDRVYRLSAPLNITRPVTLAGRGPARTVLEVASPGYGIGVRTGSRVTFRGLTVRRIAGPPGDVVRLLGGDLDLQETIITGGLSGDVAGKPTGGHGVVAGKQSKVTAAGCQFRVNHGNGVLVIESASAQLTGCVAEKNGDAGVFSRTGGAVSLTQNAFRENHTGVWVEAAAAATVEANTIEQNTESGVVLSGAVGSTAVVRGNNCLGNGKDGIHARGQSAPMVAGNTCASNKRNGLAFVDQSAGTARDNRCASNGRNGIRVGDDAAPALEENTCDANAENGVLLEDRAGGTVRKTMASDNRGDGIRLEGDASPDLEANECGHNDGYGLAVANPKSRASYDAKRQTLHPSNRRGPLLDTRPKKGGWFGR